MRHHLRVLFSASALVVGLSFGMAGCASTLQLAADTFGVDVVSESVKQKAYKAALITFVAWGGAPSPECQRGERPQAECIGGIQELIYRYGKLSPCQNTTSVLCRDDAAWSRIKSLELKTSHTLAAVEPVIAAGTDDVALMMALPTVVADAKAAIEADIKGGQ